MPTPFKKEWKNVQAFINIHLTLHRNGKQLFGLQM